MGDVGVHTRFEKGHMEYALRNNGVDCMFIEEHYTRYWETLLMMGVVIPLFLRIKIKRLHPYCLWREDNVMEPKTRTYLK